MSFSENVEVIPPDFSANGASQEDAKEAKKLQKHKWWVLSLSFMVVLVAGLLWVWSRPAIYQSQAIIHFSYAQQLNNEQTAVPEEQISLNEKRLTSNRILETLSQQLDEQLELNLTVEQLAEMMSTDSQLASRIINLYTTGENPDLLEPVLSQWLQLYLQLLEEETSDNTLDDIAIAQDKLAALEQKIIEQRMLVEQYSKDNNIISLERDENRTLAKIKSLGAALDEAETQQAEAKAALESVNLSIAEGQQVIHPADKVRFDEMRTAIKDGEAYMASLAQRYTPEYMKLDPDVVNRKRNLDDLTSRYEENLAISQQRYIEDLNRTLVASQAKQKQLEVQLDELGKDAQEFNQKLDEYGRQTRSLEQLQNQAQQMKDQIIEKEVQKPFQAKINVLEEPFVPSYPISPLYWRDSAIVLAAAMITALFALLIFSFIVRQKQPAATMTNYTVVPPSGLTLENQLAHQQALELQQQKALGHQSAPLQLTQQEQPSGSMRLLSEAELQSLYKVANRDGKIMLALLLNGASIEEALTVQVKDIEADNSTVLITGHFQRTVELSQEVVQLLVNLCRNRDEQEPLWPTSFDQEQLDHLIVNMGHDAGLPFPDQLSAHCIRHTYLTYLVSQGARLNDLEQVAGYISPQDLSLYRQVNRRGDPVDIEHLQTGFPLG